MVRVRVGFGQGLVAGELLIAETRYAIGVDRVPVPDTRPKSKTTYDFKLTDVG